MKRAPVFALIDCNNFFVSCERLFRPDLEGKPIIVLSSNDGCAVSRSNEAKALGIPMGAPAFKYRDLFSRHGVVQFSANFELYGNISRRITALLSTITPRLEVYSVDESFLDLSQLQITDYEAWGAVVRQQILDWIGIPVSIGIAPSKTLAKLANLRAKKDPALGGVLSLMKNEHTGSPSFNQAKTEAYLAQTSVSDIWGVGWRLGPKLRGEGVASALQLSKSRPQRMQQLMGIHGRQLVAELQGISCYPLQLEGVLPKTISVTRTFGKDTRDQDVVEAALVGFAAKGCFKLRRSKQLARRVTVFTATSRFKPGYSKWAAELVFDQPTADTESIIKAVTSMFRSAYNPQTMYHRAGILLHDFTPDGQLQTDLLGTVDTTVHDFQQRKNQAIDALNNKYGSSTIRHAAELLSTAWTPQANIRSPRYVSQWQDLPSIRPHIKY